MRSLLLLTLLGACGTSDTAATVLRCADFAYCATYEINQNNGGTVDRPAGPAGGPIADGMYRVLMPTVPGDLNCCSRNSVNQRRHRASTFTAAAHIKNKVFFEARARPSRWRRLHVQRMRTPRSDTISNVSTTFEEFLAAILGRHGRTMAQRPETAGSPMAPA